MACSACCQDLVNGAQCSVQVLTSLCVLAFKIGKVQPMCFRSSASMFQNFNRFMSYQAFGEVALLCNIPQPFAVTVTELCQVRWRKQQQQQRGTGTRKFDQKKKDSQSTVCARNQCV